MLILGDALHVWHSQLRVCGEFVLGLRLAGDTDLGNDCASGRNVDPLLLYEFSRFVGLVCRLLTKNGTAGRCNTR